MPSPLNPESSYSLPSPACSSRPLLDEEKLLQLSGALLYLKMDQLRAICEQFGLDGKGVKMKRIERLLAWLRTGRSLDIPHYPAVSLAPKGAKRVLLPMALILSGSYKSDLECRLFLKKLIGSHFHYTAFGLDWIKEQWSRAAPPTYQQFADFWQCEYLKRKESKPVLKEEWAYLNFCERFLVEQPGASRHQMMEAWKQCQVEWVNWVYNCLDLKRLASAEGGS